MSPLSPVATPSAERPEHETCLQSHAVHRVLTLAAAAAMALSLAACSSGSDAGSAQVTELRVGAPPSLAGLGLQVAISQEAACKDNLIVTSTVNRSAYDSMPQLLSGGLQVAQMDTITFLQARTQGLPVHIIAANGEQSTDGKPGQQSAGSIVTTPDSPITSPKDLAGKKVGVPGIKTQVWMNIRAIVDADGGDSAQIEFVEVPPAQMIDLLTQGTIDAAIPSEPLASSSIANGVVKFIRNTDVPGNKGVPSSVYVATGDFVDRNRDAIRQVRLLRSAGRPKKSMETLTWQPKSPESGSATNPSSSRMRSTRPSAPMPSPRPRSTRSPLSPSSTAS